MAFEDKYLQMIIGIIGTVLRINARTATVDPRDSTSWRVGFYLPRHVVDI